MIDRNNDSSSVDTLEASNGGVGADSSESSSGNNSDNSDSRGGNRRDNDRGSRYDRRDRGRGRGRDRGRREDREIVIAEDDVLLPVGGLLDILENFAFIRTSGYLPSPNDVYVSLQQVRKHGLRTCCRDTKTSLGLGR